MALLTKDQILGKKDLKTTELDVPEWGGGTVRISTMSGRARDRFEKSILSKNGELNHDNIRAKLLIACLVDENGELLFTEKDIIKLGNKSGAALERIFAKAQKQNRLSDDDVEELAKN